VSRILLKIEAVADNGFCGDTVGKLIVCFLAGGGALSPSSSARRLVPVAGEG